MLRPPADTLPAKAPARALGSSLQSRWGRESNSDAPGGKWTERRKGTSRKIPCFQESARYKMGPKGSADIITFWGNFSGRSRVSLGWLLCCPHWRYLLTFSWKPSLRSPLGTVSISVTADTEKTRRKNGARERGNGAWCIPGTSSPGSNRASDGVTEDLFSHDQQYLLHPCPSGQALHSGLETQVQARCDPAPFGKEKGKKGNHPNRRQSKASSKERCPKAVV